MTSWWESDPERLARDLQEVPAHFPDLQFEQVGAGQWSGRLPYWPFERSRPASLDMLTGGDGLLLDLYYPQSYPMVPPNLFPREPDPDVLLRTQHRWHLNGDGSLCLLRVPELWTGREPVTDLLLKAAGWRIEYELMKANLIDRMSENGIVTDPTYDHLVEEAPCQDSASS